MSANERYTIRQFSFEECLNDLNETSPLQMSKKLLEYELYDQQDSLEVLNQIYEEFENKQDIVDELVSPIFFNIADGLIKHPKLGLNKTGITASRLVNEIKDFDYYSGNTESKKSFIHNQHDKYINSKEYNTHCYYDSNGNKQDSRYYARSKPTAKKQGMEGQFVNYDNPNKRDTLKDKRFENKQYIRDDYTNKRLDRKDTDTDHIVTLSEGVKEYGKSHFLTDAQIKEALNSSDNYAFTSAGVNRSKNDESNTKAVNNQNKKISNLDEKSKQRMIEKEIKAKEHIEKQLNSTARENLKNDLKNTLNGNGKLVNNALDDTKNKAIGEVIILIIKPIYYEFNDIFKHGMISDLNVNDKIDAFLIRMKRVKAYVMDNAVGTLFDNIKEFLQSFVTMLINGIVNAFVGLLKKVLQVITEGFTAIISAVKILIKDKDDAGNPITPAQKADAIVKLLATTAVTFLGAYFEETILSFLNGTPIEFLKDIIMIMLTGIATTIIVWLLDQADIFSVKDEKRTLRVKEIFQLRVQVIKENTDIFEKASIEVLTKQKLQFKKIVSEMNSAIAQNLDINTSVGNMADFMNIELTVKSSNQFLHLLETNKQLNI